LENEMKIKQLERVIAKQLAEIRQPKATHSNQNARFREPYSAVKDIEAGTSPDKFFPLSLQLDSNH